jgi:hypothetical protein
VQDIASKLEYFVAENAKTARAFLKLVGRRPSAGAAAAGNQDRGTEREHAAGGAVWPCWRRCWKA